MRTPQTRHPVPSDWYKAEELPQHFWHSPKFNVITNLSSARLPPENHQIKKGAKLIACNSLFLLMVPKGRLVGGV